MTKLRCLATCYMPTPEGPLERYEDMRGEDVYSIDSSLVEEFLASGNFVRVAGPEPFSGALELTLSERRVLREVLPEAGSIATLNLVRTIQQQLEGTAKTKVVELEPQAAQLIQGEFKALDDQGKLPLAWLEVSEKFA